MRDRAGSVSGSGRKGPLVVVRCGGRAGLGWPATGSVWDHDQLSTLPGDGGLGQGGQRGGWRGIRL